MSQRRTRRANKAARPTASVSSYWDRTHWPLQCLYFLLPMLVAYQLGAILYAPDDMARVPPILAESLLRRFFEVFGVTGVYLPGLCVIAVLLGWHVMKRDPWEPEWRLYVGMLVESLLLVVPLLVLGAVIMRGEIDSVLLSLGQAGVEAGGGADGGGRVVDGAAGPGGPGVAGLSTPALMVISIGAGIFEELLFRLVAIALLHGLLVDVLQLPDRWGMVAAVVCSSLAFAFYHFGENDPLVWAHFALYCLAGVYLAVVYIVRGFGIVVAVHAIYDVIVFL
ncbi:MAG: CPBP family intramembrane glutamic endopeptidase [Planctomycetota bacterium]